ncbi:hypothetical protein FGB62_6g411 [Gracilaria domingensis]|nr:hypothetical protein FGB62_6g411 [Gracilaria domingensis]
MYRAKESMFMLPGAGTGVGVPCKVQLLLYPDRIKFKFNRDLLLTFDRVTGKGRLRGMERDVRNWGLAREMSELGKFISEHVDSEEMFWRVRISIEFCLNCFLRRLGGQICGDSLLLYCVLWMLALFLLYGMTKPAVVHVFMSENGSVSAYSWRVVTVAVIESLLHVSFIDGLQCMHEGLFGSVATENFQSERRLGIWAVSLNAFGAFTLSGLLFVNICIALSFHFFPEGRTLLDAIKINTVAFSSGRFLLGLERKEHIEVNTVHERDWKGGEPVLLEICSHCDRAVPPVLRNSVSVVLIIMYSVAEQQQRALVRSVWEGLYAVNGRERRRFVSL